MPVLTDDHPIFHNIFQVSEECFITIRRIANNLYYKYVSPSNPRIYNKGVETPLGYSATLENANTILKTWNIHKPLELTGPELPPVYKKIKQMEKRQKKRMEIKHKTNVQLDDEFIF